MRRLRFGCTVLVFAVCSSFLLSIANAGPKEARPTTISAGAAASRLPRQIVTDVSHLRGSPTGSRFKTTGFIPGIGFEAYNYDDNISLMGFGSIPPDPCGAAGVDRVIAVVNRGIECRDKIGTLIFRDSLHNLFAPLGPQTLGTYCYDPKILYDPRDNRFIVVALELWDTSRGDPSNESRVLVAVSKTPSPATASAADWWFLAINSKINIGGVDHWADYPGFAFDGPAVYVTANMFTFGASPVGDAQRIWIIDKGVASGFYAGGPPSWAVYDPIPPGFAHITMMPVRNYDLVAPVAFLVGYSSLTDGGPGAHEYLQVVRLEDPLGTPAFTGQFIDVGDLENVGGIYGFPDLPGAPQSGGPDLISTNDSRALDAVWRSSFYGVLQLWFTATINPNVGYDAPNAGQATAHWFRLYAPDAPLPDYVTYVDQGDIGGEDIAPGTSTFFPSVAVNKSGVVKFGFAASASSIYCGAYTTGREVWDAPGTVQASVPVHTGLDYYLRTYGSGENRWGDFSATAVDPADDVTFWVFNQYASLRGTGVPPEDGRWGTAWMSCLVDYGQDFGDAPDPGYPTLLSSNGARHTIVPGIQIGHIVDPDPDGQPDFNAQGDDNDEANDDDGVSVGRLTPGVATSASVNVSVNGWLDIWVEFHTQQPGWNNPEDHVYSGPVTAGDNSIPFVVPLDASLYDTYARFRYNTVGPLPPDGPAPDGEVEDFRTSIVAYDYGDAPDPPYHTLSASNGAAEVYLASARLGSSVTYEPDGQPTPNADGDGPSDDGVVFVTPMVPGHSAQANVTVAYNVGGTLDAWIDFNHNGSWLDSGDHVFSGVVSGGLNSIVFDVPAGATSGYTYARFRYNEFGATTPDGVGGYGEVEDYKVAIDTVRYDFGDAPAPYPTLLADNGARHVIFGGAFMGSGVDAEADGQPQADALGDDNAGTDDEDGVTFTSTLDPTHDATVDVVCNMAGFVDAWIDFNADSVWSSGEHILNSVPAVAGVNTYTFHVPGTSADAFDTFARFRFSLAGGLQPTGLAPDGEVEDYKVGILKDTVTGIHDQKLPTQFALYDPVPNPFNPQTTLSFALPKASHVVLTVYDVRGQLVAKLLDENRAPGVHSVVWDGRNGKGQPVASGVYLYRIQAGSFTATKRMVLLK